MVDTVSPRNLTYYPIADDDRRSFLGYASGGEGVPALAA
jgi:hypothetical protein